ncbi:MAG: tetraacyldisaccharide 4'-kinase [Candidatus Omnitrophota bacterium]|nr:tetraacyldisaccharide 4'-kinase [Candidatus Omnitrophota bacterium]
MFTPLERKPRPVGGVEKIQRGPLGKIFLTGFTIKKWYISFLEKEKRNFFESAFYLLLYFLSFVYGFAVVIRNFFYNIGLLHSYRAQKKVLSIGSLSWAGSGKTTLAMYLYDKLIYKRKVAVLRRGYGNDEGKLMQDYDIKVFSRPNRISLVKQLSRQFDAFILDDGFQYRKLKRDIDIVVMAARELQKNIKLIPVSSFREYLSSLKRANMLILNYKEEAGDFTKIKQSLQDNFPHLKIYLANYEIEKLMDFNSNEIAANSLRNKPVAAITAIGYPKGFFSKLREMRLNIVKEIAYPDHYEFNPDEFIALQNNLRDNGILDIIITHKDKYHIPKDAIKLNIYIMKVKIKIEEEEDFLKEIEKGLA